MKKQAKIFVDNDNDANQSCPPIMQEDITRSINQQDVRIVKSQQFRPSAMDDSTLKNINQGDKNQPVIEVQRHHSKSFSQQKIEVKTIYKKKGTDFDCQKVQSIQMSCEQQTYRSVSIKSKSKNITQNNEQQQQQPRTGKKSRKAKQLSPRKPYLENKMQEIKQDVLNVLIAGSEDMGKTMFIRCFKKKERKPQQPCVKQRTKDIRYELGMMDQNLVNRRNTVYFIDLPGFKQNEKDKYLREIKQYACKQWENYLLKPQQDRRIHCCLYFMRGPRIKQSDLTVMRQLSLWFNLIPIIAKSDQYTKQEIFEMKADFHRRVAQVGVQVFDIEEFYRLKRGTQGLSQFIQSPFGKFPPFVITSSFEKQSPESNDFVRKYPWGKVEIENKEHTDFEKLCRLLSGDIRSQLINKLVDLRTIEEQERVQNVEGVIGGQVQREDKASTGWKAKIVLGSVVVAIVFAFLAKKSGGVGLFKE